MVLVGLSALAPTATASTKSASCQKMTGQVLLTDHDPDTIMLSTGKGMNIATVFTLTPTTTYTRNGLPAILDGSKYLDTGYVSFQDAYPSGSLLACAVKAGCAGCQCRSGQTPTERVRGRQYPETTAPPNVTRQSI